MATRDYERLEIEDFGRHLLSSNDLDPIYVALHGTGWDLPLLKRWMLAYACFYHAGVASWIAEEPRNRFWMRMGVAAANITPAPHGGRFQRGKERRHFRGQQATKAVHELSARYDRGDGFIDYVASQQGYGVIIDYAAVRDRVKEHRGFGDWIAFKIGDLIDRVLPGVEVSFKQAEVFMYRDPRQAALKLFRSRGGVPDGAKLHDEDAAVVTVVEHLVKHFSNHLAPPTKDRQVGVQEVETILCKWKSHMHGHYPLFNDIDEITEGIQPWLEHSPLAGRFLEAMPKRSS